MTCNKVDKLTMSKISMEFPGVKALNNVDYEIETGTIHALIGANGAGKSTLMKTLVGVYQDYNGEIALNGQVLKIKSPKDAKDLGIEIVYQEVDTALIPYLTVAENVILEQYINNMGKKQLINWNRLYEESEEVLNKLNIKIATRKIVKELTLAEKQMVLIARAVSKKCRFLLLDEPTAALSQVETEELFRVMRELKAQNVGIVFISHRLPEVFAIADQITVMRDGEVVLQKQIGEINQIEAVESMMGRKIKQQTLFKSKIGKKLFEVQNLSDGNKVHDINFAVHSGEIVAIAGLVGAGKTELCNALFGASPLKSGERLIANQPAHFHNPHQAVEYGLALVPEERRNQGIFINESVKTNLTITNLDQYCQFDHFINSQLEKASARELIDQIGIKTTNEEVQVAFLSGGNQQKVVIGKWLITDAQIYIFDEPTKGIDVNAKSDLFELIKQLAQSGKAIIYASCDFQEILSIANRIFVMYDGKFIKEFLAESTSEEELLFYATGGGSCEYQH